MDPVQQLLKIPQMGPEEHASSEDIVRQQGINYSLKNKISIVTGAASGMGVATASSLASLGSKVFILDRDVDKAKIVAAEINAKYPESSVEVIELQLDSLASVKATAKEFLSKSNQLNILVNNAGVLQHNNIKTKDGHEFHFGINYLGHFMLTFHLLPLLINSSTKEFQSRVVNMSSRGHMDSNVDLNDLHFEKRGYDGFKSYGQSKTAMIFFTREIERRYGSKGVHSWAIDPGTIPTPLCGNTTIAQWAAIGLLTPEGNPVNSGYKIKSVSQGAATCVWGAIGRDLEGKGGMFLQDLKIISPVTEIEKKNESEEENEKKKEGIDVTVKGIAPYAYDDKAAVKLWEYSEKIVEAF